MVEQLVEFECECGETCYYSIKPVDENEYGFVYRSEDVDGFFCRACEGDLVAYVQTEEDE